MKAVAFTTLKDIRSRTAVDVPRLYHIFIYDGLRHKSKNPAEAGFSEELRLTDKAAPFIHTSGICGAGVVLCRRLYLTSCDRIKPYYNGRTFHTQPCFIASIKIPAMTKNTILIRPRSAST